MRHRIETLAEGVELHLGDCLEVLPTLGRFDAVVTDPPYGINLGYASFEDSPENVAELVSSLVPIARAMASRVAITCGVPNLWKYPAADWVLNWTDPAGEGGCVWGFPSWQPIIVYGKDPYLASGLGRRSDTVVRRFLRDKSPNGHPCPKPIGAMEWIVERTTLIGHSVLDPFMGSGTTGIACAKLGRTFTGVELDPGYFDIACKRIEQALRQPDFFVEQPAPKAEQLSILDGAA